MTGTIIKEVRKTDDGYVDISRDGNYMADFMSKMEIFVKDMTVIEWLNKEYPTTVSKENPDDIFEMFFPSEPVIWEYDETENVYFSRYSDDNTITGDAFKVIRDVNF